MTDATGINAQPRPRRRRRRRAQPGSSARGAATTPACKASRPASDGIRASAVASAQALLQRLELLAELRRELVPELLVVLADLWHLLLPALDVDGEQLAH